MEFELQPGLAVAECPDAGAYPMKTQWIRVADVFAIGPVMTWAGLKLSKEAPVLGPALAVFGVATILYNGNNWLRGEQGRLKCT